MNNYLNHDRLFKELLSTFFLEFLDLFFPTLAAEIDSNYLEFLDKEIFTDVTSGERYETDIIVKTRLGSQETFILIHVENQAQYEADFNKRMFRYFARLSEKYNLPVYPIVLLSFDSPCTRQPSSYEVAIGDRTILQFNYQVIQLNRLNWRDFMCHENPVATALMAKMRIDKNERWRVKLYEIRKYLLPIKSSPTPLRKQGGVGRSASPPF